jgi:protoporphyrinogen oxidase
LNKPHVVILGGGPAGVGAAYYLAKGGHAQATVLEQQAVPGGNAASFVIDGVAVDFGSHRLHHASDPAILAELKALLGDELVSNPRQGRIRLRGKWVHFPLKPVDLLLRLDRGFAAGSMRDMVMGKLKGRDNGANGAGEDTFASVLEASLGPTICEHFYFPYARKLWGRDPRELSGIQARKRVSAGTFGKLLKRVFRPPGSGMFYYPRQGFGRITTALAEAAEQYGATLRTGTRVTRLEPRGGGGWTVGVERDGAAEELHADYVWSTLPTPLVARMMQPAAPADVYAAADAITYRSMVLAYLVLDVGQFSTTDAHYFPEEDVAMTRLSEPKNYPRRTEPQDRTVLCAEIPCQAGDEVWKLSDEEIGERVVADMARAGLRLSRPPVRVETRRLKHAYPIYQNGYEVPFGVLDSWAEALPDFLLFGRQALFAHDNTHHGLYMARAAVDCLGDDGFDMAKWHRYRDVFATHVVED